MTANTRTMMLCAALLTPLTVPSSNAAPIIICQPDTVLVKQNKKARFTVKADSPAVPPESAQLTFQWQRRGPGMTNYVNVMGATNSTYTINNATTNDVAYYRAQVSSTNGTTASEGAQLLVYTKNSPITVYGSPVVSSGGSGSCPGPYAGYIVYRKAATAGWGWAGNHGIGGGSVHTATDNNRSDTKVEAFGYENDWLCPGGNSVPTGHPGPPAGAGEDSKYRFTIYFPSAVPTTSYPITLDGFKP